MDSIWSTSCKMPDFPTLKKDKRTDVLIIGGGITGILTAYMLKQKGINYTLVEKDKICKNTTANTTAKITYQHGLIYNKILKSYGLEKAQMYLSANKLAFEKIEELCKNINCDYEKKDNYVYSLNNRQKIIDELNALNIIGYKAEFCEVNTLPFYTVGAVKFDNQTQFNPLKFLSEISKNLNIYEKTFVKDIIGNKAVTERGIIKADKIIVATHFPFINTHGSYFLKQYQHRSYVIALENAENVNGMYVDENNKGMSFRNYNDLLLVGGGGNRTGKRCGSYNELRSFIKEKYPLSKEVCHYATQDCMSLDGIPYIGNYSKNTKNLYVASGFNKWGMTNSMTSAMLLSDMIMGKKNEYEEVFSPSRSILKPQLLINSYEAVTNLASFSKKRCSHLGCALKWNKYEHTWDCACHGSRFSTDGDVLNNPANKDIK